MDVLAGIALFLLFISCIMILHYRAEIKSLKRENLKSAHKIDSLGNSYAALQILHNKLNFPSGSQWKNARFKTGLQIKDVSKKTGINESYIEKLEEGRLRTLEVQLIRKLILFYDNSPSRP